MELDKVYVIVKFINNMKQLIDDNKKFVVNYSWKVMFNFQICLC